MANVLKRVTGTASIAGSTIFTVPIDTTLTIIGCRLANKTMENQTAHVTIGGTLVSGIDTPIPVGAAMDIMVGSKIVALTGDTIVAFASDDAAIDVYVSYLEQTPDGVV